MQAILLIISILPVILLGLYIYKKDTEKEPKSLIAILFASGFLSALLVIVTNVLIVTFFPEYYVSRNYTRYSFVELLILVFLEMGLLEEISKWIMIKLLGFKNKEFDQLYDIIVYSVFVSLGFAAFENIFYVMQGGLEIGIYRAIFSVPGHAAFGVMMGYLLGYAKTSKTKNMKYAFIVLSIFVPALLHTVYNFCLIEETTPYLLMFLGFMIILYFTSFRKIDEFIEYDQKYKKIVEEEKKLDSEI